MDTTELTIIKLGKKTTLFSFIGGTLLFVAFCICRESFLIDLGQKYLLFALTINLLVLFTVILSCFLYTENRNVSILTALKMLINIPVAILYFLIVISIAV